MPALIRSIEEYLATTNLLADAPSVRVCAVLLAGNARPCRLRAAGNRRTGRCVGAVAAGAVARNCCARRWPRPAAFRDVRLRGTRAACPTCRSRTSPSSPTSTTPCRSATRGFAIPTTRASTPRRSSTTSDSRPRAKTLMMLYKRLREIDVPEMMASIIHQTQGQAVGLLPRHVAPALGRGPPRHDGRGRLRRPGHRLDAGPINFTWSLRLNTQFTPHGAARRAVLHRAGADAARPASATSGRSARSPATAAGGD